MTRIVFADDHPMIRAAVEAMLRGSDYELVAKAGSGAEALALVEQHDPELVILDIQMPDGTGLEVLRQLRCGGDDRPVILLTASIEDSSFTQALALKVDGVLLKTSDPALLIDCLDAVRRGESWIDPQIQTRTVAAPASDAVVSLSPREQDLVKLVRQGLRNREIAEQLGLTEGTVKVYLHALFEKLGVANRTELAIRAGNWVVY